MMDVADIPAAAAADCAPGEIAVSAVSKWFDTPDGEALTVLQNISVAVPAQSIFAILGASGCGKSTLLNVIAGILKPDRGNVCFGGVPSSEFTDWRSISYMFQEDRLLPWRTAIQNVEFSLETGNMPRAERTRRAHDVLQLVELSAFEDSFPHQLSGGMRSRVALARSLVTENQLLRETARSAGDQSRAALLDDLERVLVAVANGPASESAEDLDALKARIQSNDLLFKVRVMSANTLQEGRKL